MTHECARIGAASGTHASTAFVECACGWAETVSAPSKVIAQCRAIDKFAQHVTEANDG